MMIYSVWPTMITILSIVLLLFLFFVVARLTYLRLHDKQNIIQQIKEEFHTEMKRRGYEK